MVDVGLVMGVPEAMTVSVTHAVEMASVVLFVEAVYMFTLVVVTFTSEVMQLPWKW